MRGLVVARPGDPSQQFWQLSQTYAPAILSNDASGPYASLAGSF
jgi:hypothetical protein